MTAPDFAGYEDIKQRYRMNGGRTDGRTGPRFVLKAFEDIKLSTEAFFTVRDVIPREGLVIVWGPPKCGKTFFVTDLALHIALGWPYRDRRVVQGTVVYVACEGERGLARRIEAFRRDRLTRYDQKVPFYLLTTRLDLARDREQLIGDIRAQLDEKGCSVVVIDTLNRSLGGGENNDQDMGDYIKAADAIREKFHCVVIVIHHCGQDGSHPRGHTSLPGAGDTQIAMPSRDANGQIVATVEYMKDGEAGTTIRSTLKQVDLGEDENGDPIRSCVVEPVDDGTAAPKQSALKGQAKHAHKLLQDAIVRAGEPAPNGDHFPRGITVVPLELWRSYCEKGGLTAGDNEETSEGVAARA